MVAGLAATACAAGGGPEERASEGSAGGGGPTSGPGATAGVGGFSVGDGGSPAQAPAGTVYAIAGDILHTFDPTTSTLAEVGHLTGGCTTAWGFAIDSYAKAYVTCEGGRALYALDLATAATTWVAGGSDNMDPSIYPGAAMAFLPKGTLDPDKESLVGYRNFQYVQIDPATGAVTVIGPGLTPVEGAPSGMVSVDGGGVFVVIDNVVDIAGVTCGDSGDCLLQVDPLAGEMLQSYGPVLGSHGYHVNGLAFWAGKVFGFGDRVDFETHVYAVEWINDEPKRSDIPLPQFPLTASFTGASSSPKVPASGPDGDGPPLK